MTSNAAEIVPHVQQDFHALVVYVSGAEARGPTASTVELTLCRRLLALGAVWLRLCLVTRAAVRPGGSVLAPDGTPLRYHAQRPTTSDSLLGKVRLGRHDFTAPGQAGRCPLEAELSVPACGDSDL
jgi:hypothetical protein